MADYNRNERGSSRYSNQDWNENKNRSGRSESDNDRNFGYGNNMGFDEDDSNWQSRYERENSNRMGSSSGRYGRTTEGDTYSGGWGDRDSSSNWGSSNYGGGSGYGSGMSSGRRNLYDRDYEGMNRGSYANSGSRLGAGNYGSYGDRGRFNEGRGGSNFGGSGGSNYGGNFGGSNYGRQDFNRPDEDRGFWDRASDEVSSWFGNEEAERRRERDKRMEGEHRGRGPKNYKRSDERIKDDLNDRLSDDPFIDASEIDVTVSNGEVTLTGTVDHRSTKRRAEDLAESISGVKNVENRIRVGQTSGSTMGSSTSGSMGSTASTGTTGSTTESTSSSGSQSTSAVPGSSGSERSRSKGNYVTG